MPNRLNITFQPLFPTSFYFYHHKRILKATFVCFLYTLFTTHNF